MIKTRKIRGHRRGWKDIADWVEDSRNLDLEYLKSRNREYVKLWIHPWSSISIRGSEIGPPRGKSRQLMLQGLLDIYNSWKVQLDSLNEPYYLKIWLFDPHFSRSQVVCALGDMLNFYDQTFYKPQEQKVLHPEHFGKLSTQVEALNWELHWDEHHFKPDDLGTPEDYYSLKDYLDEKRWFEGLMQKSLRKTTAEQPNGDIIEYFAYKQGQVWIGGE